MGFKIFIFTANKILEKIKKKKMGGGGTKCLTNKLLVQKFIERLDLGRSR